MPQWVEAGVGEYARRFTGGIRFELKQIALGARSASADPARAVAGEGRRMLAAVRSDTFVATLEIRGKTFTTEQLAAWLQARMRSGQDLTLMIGGPDGLAPECMQRSNHRWSLSPLTLPHGLARLIVVEQLYRAQTILSGHPYHRP